METFEFSRLAGNIGLTALGVIMYTAYLVLKRNRGTFNLADFKKQNAVFLIAASVIQICYATAMSFFPVLEQAIAERLIAVVNAAFAANWEINKDFAVTIVYLLGTWLISYYFRNNLVEKNEES